MTSSPGPPRRFRLLVMAVLAISVIGAACGGVRAQPDAWTLVVLGIAQDGGIPHLGCQQERCVLARDGRGQVEKVASLGLVNRATGAAYLFDATPLGALIRHCNGVLTRTARHRARLFVCVRHDSLQRQ